MIGSHSVELLRPLILEKNLSNDTQAIVVMSADPQQYAENLRRINQAVSQAREVVTHKSGKEPKQLTPIDMLQAPILLLVGQSEYLSEMLGTALSLGHPSHRILLVDAGTIQDEKLQNRALNEVLEESNFSHVLKN